MGRAGVGIAFVLRGLGLFVGALSVLGSRGFAPVQTQVATAVSTTAEGGEPTKDSSSSSSTRSDVTWMVRRLVVGCLPMFTLSAMRQSRSAVIPLVGAEIGIGPQQLGVLVGMASMAETVLFLPAGFLYDTIGAQRPIQVSCTLYLATSQTTSLTLAMKLHRHDDYARRPQGYINTWHASNGRRFHGASPGQKPSSAGGSQCPYRRRQWLDFWPRAATCARPSSSAARRWYDYFLSL